LISPFFSEARRFQFQIYKFLTISHHDYRQSLLKGKPMNATTDAKKPKRKNAAFKHLMALHWIMAAFILSLYVTGIFVARPYQEPVLDWLIPSFHQSFGILFLILLVARIFLLLRLIGTSHVRRSPKRPSNWLPTIVLHSSLYFFMLIVPVSGFFLRNFTGLDTTFFGISVPPVFVADESWAGLSKNLHFWSAYVFLAFIFLHVVAYWKMVWINVRKGFNNSKKAFFKRGES